MNEAVVIRVSMKHRGGEDIWLLEHNGNVIATARTFDEIKSLALRNGYAITQYKFTTVDALEKLYEFRESSREHRKEP